MHPSPVEEEERTVAPRASTRWVKVRHMVCRKDRSAEVLLYLQVRQFQWIAFQ